MLSKVITFWEHFFMPYDVFVLNFSEFVSIL